MQLETSSRIMRKVAGRCPRNKPQLCETTTLAQRTCRWKDQNERSNAQDYRLLRQATPHTTTLRI
jgi:hypothetical protein